MSTEVRSRNQRTVDRRELLLASTTPVPAATVGSATPVQMVQTQQPPPTLSRRPNTLVIWGNDIGITDVST